MREVTEVDGITKVTYRPYANQDEKNKRKAKLKDGKANLQRTLRRATESNARNLQEIRDALKVQQNQSPKPIPDTTNVVKERTRSPIRQDVKTVPRKDHRRSDLYIPNELNKNKNNRR